MERSTSEKIKLGVFVIAGSILLVVAAYLIGNRQNMFGGNFELRSVFKNVNGLQTGNNVRFSGINVGTVSGLEMINDTSIQVNMLIDNKMLEHIRRDAIAAVGSDGLVGSMLVNIIPGKGMADLVSTGDEIRSYSRIATEDMLSTLSVSNENIALLTADLLEITNSLISGKGTLGLLLKDTIMASDLSQTLANLNQVSEKANSAIGDLNGIVEDMKSQESVAGVLLSDPASADKVRSMISGLDSSSMAIERITTDVEDVVAELKEGNGAFHYLATDSNFVSRLDSTMQNIQKSSVLLNEDLEALKHSFLLRKYFKKQEKEKAKEERAK